MTPLRIIVPSHFSYSDAWIPFMRLFDRFWPDCPYDRAIWSSGGQLNMNPTPSDWFVMQYKLEMTWCERLLQAAKFADEYLLVLQEDFFITTNVQSESIASCADWLDTNPQFSAVRLAPIPGPDGQELSDELGELTLDAQYRVSCQATIWRCKDLTDLLRGILDTCQGSPSDFERLGSQISSNQRYACWKRELTPWPIQYICSAISRGKWNQDALNLCKQYNIDIKSDREICQINEN